MATITVTQGGPDIEPGVYPVSLTSINGPKTVTAQRGPNAGQDIDLFDWSFAIMGGDHDGVEVQASTSTASGPRSKMYAFLTALFGGRPPAIGSSFDTSQLVGKIALATISKTPDGWARIDNLGAMPASMLAQGISQATGAPLQAAPAPAQAAAPAAATAPASPPAAPSQQVGAGQPGDLPF